jgi:colanic acid/amylovoran biosynthesis glycosyltransferase
MSKPNVVIYRDLLLPSSETFVKTQTEGLTQFQPYYAGYYKLSDGLELDPSHEIYLQWKDSKFNNRYTEKYLKKPLIHSQLYRKLKKIHPVLIHAHFGPDGLLALPLAKKLNIPLIVTFHGYDVTTSDEYLLKSRSYNIHHYVSHNEKLKKSNTHFIAASKFIKQKLIEKGFPEKQIITHYIGVNLDLFQPNESVTREKVILFVGRLVRNKGCEYLIRAMREVQIQHPDTRLVIIGEGDQKESLKKLATQLNVQAEFLGKLPYTSVVGWMNRAKIFSVPSIEVESGASEGFGMVFAEAQAMGLPVVSFNTGGISEAVSDEETGLLAKQKDWQQLSTNIIKLMDDKELWHSYSSKGIKRVKEQFNLRQQNKKLEEIYQSILSSKI